MVLSFGSVISFYYLYNLNQLKHITMEQNPKKVKGILKVGDKVSWRGAWGIDAPKEVIVEEIESNCGGSKNGTAVDSVEWDEVTRENVVVTLSSGNWAYGNQLKEI